MKKIKPIIKLLKLRMTFFIIVTVSLGYYYASPGITDWPLLIWALLGSGFLAFSCFAINQVMEIEFDKKMDRTKNRPLPQGDLSKSAAWGLGLFFFVAGSLIMVYKVNLLSMYLGIGIVISYCLLYTPFKRISHLNTLIGAVPGALPPLIGWAAARNEIGAGAILMFMILFFWQLPHFLAIAWLYKDDYASGEFEMLSVVDPTGASVFRQILLQTFFLVVASTVPYFLGLAGNLYLWVALLAGGYFLARGIILMKTKTKGSARGVFIFSLIYLPCILAFLIIDKNFVS